MKEFLAAMFVCTLVQECVSAQVGIKSWDQQIMEINALERAGKLATALNAAMKLESEIERSQSKSSLLPSALDRVASLEQDLGRYTDAERHYELSVKAWESIGSTESLGLAKELNNLGTLYSDTSQLSKAESAIRRSLDLRIQLLGPRDPEVALSHSNLATALVREQAYAAAESEARAAIDIWEYSRPQQNHSDLGYSSLAWIALRSGRPQAAVKWARLAIASYHAREGYDRIDLATYNRVLALAQVDAGNLPEARQSFQTSLSLLNEMDRPTTLRVEVLQEYAQLLNRIGERKEAHSLLKRARTEAHEMKGGNTFQSLVDIKAFRGDR